MGSIRFTVRDSGAGIAAEHLPRLFEKFDRVPGSRSRGGAGPVLAIDREVVVAHGGQIAVENQVDRGTVSIVTLPTDPDLGQLASHELAI